MFSQQRGRAERHHDQRVERARVVPSAEQHLLPPQEEWPDQEVREGQLLVWQGRGCFFVWGLCVEGTSPPAAKERDGKKNGSVCAERKPWPPQSGGVCSSCFRFSGFWWCVCCLPSIALQQSRRSIPFLREQPQLRACAGKDHLEAALIVRTNRLFRML